MAAEETQRAGATDAEASDLGNVSELDSTLDAEEEVPPSPGGNASPPSPPASPRLPDIRPGVRLLPLAAPKLAPLPQGTYLLGLCDVHLICARSLCGLMMCDALARRSRTCGAAGVSAAPHTHQPAWASARQRDGTWA